MREFISLLSEVTSKGLVFATLVTIIIGMVELELQKYKAKKDKERKAKLNKRREEFEAKMNFKKRAFEEYKSYIESLNFNEEEEAEEVEDEVEVEEEVVELDEGVSRMIRNAHHNYRPYEINNFDLRDTLREFTVQDVLNAFYI